MKDDELFGLDFNSLKVLKILGEERNTKRAAERLYIGQSAVSKALKKLREQFSDPLFTRTLHGLQPTEKCLRLLDKMPQVMASLDQLYHASEFFNATDYQGEITIHINAGLCFPTITELFKRLHQLAPLATLHIENWSVNTESLLKQGLVDIGINHAGLSLSKSIFEGQICYPEIKLCCHKESVLALAKKVSIEDVANTPLVVMPMPEYNKNEDHIEVYLKQRGYQPSVFLCSDKLDICLETLIRTNSVMAVSEIVASQLYPQLTLIDVNHWGDIPHKTISYYAAQRLKRTPFSKWLSRVVEQVMRELCMR